MTYCCLQHTQYDILHQEKKKNNPNIQFTFSIPYNTNTTHIGLNKERQQYTRNLNVLLLCRFNTQTCL